MCFIASKDITISLNCSFPNQAIPEPKKITKTALATASKDIREKFRRQVYEKMEEIESSLNAHKKYFNDIAEMKRRRQQAGLKNNDLNFIEKNVDGIDEIFEVKAY